MQLRYDHETYNGSQLSSVWSETVTVVEVNSSAVTLSNGTVTYSAYGLFFLNVTDLTAINSSPLVEPRSYAYKTREVLFLDAGTPRVDAYGFDNVTFDVNLGLLVEGWKPLGGGLVERLVLDDTNEDQFEELTYGDVSAGDFFQVHVISTLSDLAILGGQITLTCTVTEVTNRTVKFTMSGPFYNDFIDSEKDDEQLFVSQEDLAVLEKYFEPRNATYGAVNVTCLNVTKGRPNTDHAHFAYTVIDLATGVTLETEGFDNDGVYYHITLTRYPSPPSREEENRLWWDDNWPWVVGVSVGGAAAAVVVVVVLRRRRS
ncbi:MAG: hypothetical protein Kow0069_05940 [Promethearchaeota archaeon]